MQSDLSSIAEECRGCEMALEGARKRRRTVLAEIDAEIALAEAALGAARKRTKIAAYIAEARSRGYFTIRHGNLLELLKTLPVRAPLWRVEATMKANTRVTECADSECKLHESICENRRCRFKPECVVPHCDVPIVHFQDLDHKVCLLFCKFCAEDPDSNRVLSALSRAATLNISSARVCDADAEAFARVCLTT